MQILTMEEIGLISGGRPIQQVVIRANKMSQEEKDQYDWDNSWYGSALNKGLEFLFSDWNEH
ncbi:MULTISPECIES: hypothetical protein [unclassified Janthinobacterium]|uniref:hypothetical protein n=1 Tax=unclassified Janthinobacterium TaxID=2610881 RepID=UPI00130535F7|nr:MULTISPECIES: hypothetical protein [unclassified Janthinobacterium]MDZ5633527.1 hypothetical protein [Janthinobacterium sp. GMG1]